MYRAETHIKATKFKANLGNVRRSCLKVKCEDGWENGSWVECLEPPSEGLGAWLRVEHFYKHQYLRFHPSYHVKKVDGGRRMAGSIGHQHSSFSGPTHT